MVSFNASSCRSINKTKDINSAVVPIQVVKLIPATFCSAKECIFIILHGTWMRQTKQHNFTQAITRSIKFDRVK